MGKFKYVMLLFISFFFATSNIGAATCDFEEKAKLNNEVGNIKANYEILQETIDDAYPPDSILGTEWEDSYTLVVDYINVNILNITENVYLEISNDYEPGIKTYSYTDSKDGIISFRSPSIWDIIKYKIVVKASNNTGCEGTVLKTIPLSLPRYNDYSQYSLCSTLPDYYLCQEYVTFPDNISFETFTEYLIKEIEKQEEEEEQQKWYQKLGDFVVEHKNVLIIVGVAVVAIGGATFVILKRRGRDEI